MAQPTPEPTPKKIPWEDYVPTYVEDNAKGYPRYVDKLARALNGVIEGGKGGGVFTFTIEADENDDFVIETPFSEIASAFDEGKTVIAIIQAQSPDGEYKETGFGLCVSKESQDDVTGCVFFGCCTTDHLPNGDSDYELVMDSQTGVVGFIVVEGHEDVASVEMYNQYYNSLGYPATPVGIQFSMTDANTITTDLSYKIIRYFVEHNTPAYGYFDSQSYTRTSTQNILNKCFTPFALYMGGTGSTSNIYGDMLYWDGSTAKKYTIVVASNNTVTFSTSNLTA